METASEKKQLKRKAPSSDSVQRNGSAEKSKGKGKAKAAEASSEVDSNGTDYSSGDDEDSENDEDEDDSEGSDAELVNVDFDYFDPRPNDFHAVKRLMGQLFGTDGKHVPLSELSDMICQQQLIGTTIKVDGSEADPYSLLTVLNLNDKAVSVVLRIRSQVNITKSKR